MASAGASDVVVVDNGTGVSVAIGAHGFRIQAVHTRALRQLIQPNVTYSLTVP